MASPLQSCNRADRGIAERSMPPRSETNNWRVRGEIEALLPRLTRYARSLTHDLVAADDLVQESVSRALQKIHLWHADTDLRAWLFTIMHHQYVDAVRRAAREVPLGERDQPLDPQQPKRLEVLDLAGAIEALPREQKAAIMLIAVEEMRYDEAALVLGVPLGTVRSRVSRGRTTLRRLTGRPPCGGAGAPAKPGNEIEEPLVSRRRETRKSTVRQSIRGRALAAGATDDGGRGRGAGTRRSAKVAG